MAIGDAKRSREPTTNRERCPYTRRARATNDLELHTAYRNFFTPKKILDFTRTMKLSVIAQGSFSLFFSLKSDRDYSLLMKECVLSSTSQVSATCIVSQFHHKFWLNTSITDILRLFANLSFIKHKEHNLKLSQTNTRFPYGPNISKGEQHF